MSSTTFCRLLLAALIVPISLFAAPSDTASVLDAVKRKPEQWIELKKRIAETRHEWQSQKEILAHSIFVMQKTLEELEREVQEQDARTSSLNVEYDNLLTELSNARNGQQALLERIDELEIETRQLARYCPLPLRETLAPHLRQLSSASTAEDSGPLRLQAVLAALTLMDEFNKGLTLSHVPRSTEDGSTTEVRVLYWGLAQAYAADAEGERAWLITPAEDGWHWREAPEHGAAIKRLFDVYGDDISPELVPLPSEVLIKGKDQ